MYSRELDGKTYTFGVSGKLLHDALLMYDHQTRTLWSHITGEAVTAQLKGKRLTMLASMPQITWKEWRLNYPNTGVQFVQFDPRHPDRQFEERKFDIMQAIVLAPTRGSVLHDIPITVCRMKRLLSECWLIPVTVPILLQLLRGNL